MTTATTGDQTFNAYHAAYVYARAQAEQTWQMVLAGRASYQTYQAVVAERNARFEALRQYCHDKATQTEQGRITRPLPVVQPETPRSTL